MPVIDQYPDATDPLFEHLRQGTRKQYVSGWTAIPDTEAVSFTHDLGEVPMIVDVIQSTRSDGFGAIEAGTDATVTKTDTTITVTSAVGGNETRYFQVRAM